MVSCGKYGNIDGGRMVIKSVSFWIQKFELFYDELWKVMEILKNGFIISMWIFGFRVLDFIILL